MEIFDINFDESFVGIKKPDKPTVKGGMTVRANCGPGGNPPIKLESTQVVDPKAGFKLYTADCAGPGPVRF